jgi:uncharacterized protein with HEPN domain
MLLEAERLIERRARASLADLHADEDLAAAFAWRLVVIGEAASRISEATQVAYPDIPWQQIIGMRHRVVHGYYDLDLNVMWQTIEIDLPPLIRALRQILNK